jgi:Gly-Xaa carboxypeptidase
MKGLEDTHKTKRTTGKFRKLLGYSLGVATVLATAIYGYQSFVTDSTSEIPKSQYSDIKKITPSSSKGKAIYEDDAFRNASLAKYQGALRIPTEVYDFTSRPELDITGWEPFLDLHDYFEKTFPLVHKHLKVEKVNKLGLVITYEGSDSDLKPLILTAHQDVVPVDQDTLDLWNYDPYSAHYDGKYVWARGASDTKSLLVAILETFEEFLQDDYKPKRTIVFSSSYDEEAIGRYEGAKSLAGFLQDRYGADGAYALVDEGSSVTDYGETLIAAPSVAEKGYVDVYIELRVPGGHSAGPPDHTAIGIIGGLTTSLESDPYGSEIVDENPLFDYLRAIGEYTNEFDEQTRDDFIKARYDHSARERTIKKLSDEKSFKYLFRTSQAIDIIEAGVKINALPEVLKLGINHRISHGTNVEDVLHKITKHVSKIASKHELGVSLFNGTVLEETTSQGFFNISWVQPLNPSPISRTEGHVWNTFAGSIKHTFEDIVLPGRKVEFGPTVTGGYTDASRYWSLTDNIYRFIGAVSRNEKTSNAHAINEHLEFDLHIQSIAFLYDFILNINEHDS